MAEDTTTKEKDTTVAVAEEETEKTEETPVEAEEVTEVEEAEEKEETAVEGEEEVAGATEVVEETTPEVTEEKETATSDTKATDEPVDDRVMAQYLPELQALPDIGDITEGPVIAIDKSAVYINLAPVGTGIIYGREFMNARDLIKRMGIGDLVAAKVVERENENGYIELSLKEARQSLIWGEAEEIVKTKSVMELPVKDANKGGLIIEWQGIQGFLPASQLSKEHYPRVEDGDKDRILEELRSLIGSKLTVTIITAIPSEGKLIFSEKEHIQKDKEEIVGKYEVGKVVEGEVTGIVDFGIFLKIEDGLEGLVHISEIDWGLVDDPRKMFTPGDKINAKIIEIKDNKISLSVKALKDNPWSTASEKYKKGDIVRGVVIKFNKYGALASIEEGVAGLVHVSEFGSEEKLREKLELGKTYAFQITLFEPKEQRMTLAYLEDKAEEKAS